MKTVLVPLGALDFYLSLKSVIHPIQCSSIASIYSSHDFINVLIMGNMQKSETKGWENCAEAQSSLSLNL